MRGQSSNDMTREAKRNKPNQTKPNQSIHSFTALSCGVSSPSPTENASSLFENVGFALPFPDSRQSSSVQRKRIQSNRAQPNSILAYLSPSPPAGVDGWAGYRTDVSFASIISSVGRLWTFIAFFLLLLYILCLIACLLAGWLSFWL